MTRNPGEDWIEDWFLENEHIAGADSRGGRVGDDW